MSEHELNFDSLVGPTHNYAGLAFGNTAAMSHGGDVSNPRAAALQGLEKMRTLASLGVAQAVLPPHERPDVAALRELGFSGSDAAVIEAAARAEPRLLAAVSSASAMWAANAATVSPSADTGDRRVHFTPANLATFFHRSLEVGQTARTLKAIFKDPALFAHHEPLAATPVLGDEGAANHSRLTASQDARGVEIFVHGDVGPAGERRFPARQRAEASRAVARLHGLDPAATLFVAQSPAAIDAGVFHNDVIAVGHRHVLFFHELAFADRDAALSAIRAAFTHTAGIEPALVEVGEADLSLDETVSSYVFNSQLVTTADDSIVLVCPAEVERSPRATAVVEEVVYGDSPITDVRYVEIRESMRNGGGPACLRLRVALNARERAAVHRGVLYDRQLHGRLDVWIRAHYRDRLAPEDLADPALLEESRRALDELTALLGLPALYPFQQV